MQRKLLNVLKCIECSNTTLKLETEEAGDDVIFGSVYCPVCNRRYEIKSGILIALPGNLSPLELSEIQSSHRYSKIENDEYNASKIRRMMCDYQYSYLENYTDKESLLEIGSGNGYFLTKHKDNLKLVVGLDISFNALLNARERGILNLIQAEAKHLPLCDMSFSNIVTQDALHHMPEPTKCLDEIMRVLKKRGRIFIQDKNHNNFLIPIIDIIILKMILKKIGELTFIKRPMKQLEIISFIEKKVNVKPELSYYNILLRPLLLPLEIMQIKSDKAIRFIISLDRRLSRIPILTDIFSWRFNITVFADCPDSKKEAPEKSFTQVSADCLPSAGQARKGL